METEVGGDERAPDLHWQHFRPKEQQYPTPKLLGYRLTKVGLISAALIKYLIKLNQ